MRSEPSLQHLNTIGSGSYAHDDVHCLLRPIELASTGLLEKERLVQSRARHYSELISHELAPSSVVRAGFEQAMQQGVSRLAREVQALANGIAVQCPGPIVLVSLVRAGLPVGVLLRRALLQQGREVYHYGISILRHRGIDNLALEAVISRHGTHNLVFVDGWTGKGSISSELEHSLSLDPRFDAVRLVVLADPCGRAWMAASAQDWLIPSSLLGATVSGLISRSVWPDAKGLHACVVYGHLHAQDLTRDFVERVDRLRSRLGPQPPAAPWSASQLALLRAEATQALTFLMKHCHVQELDRIKPGIAEATRAVLRRIPERVLLHDHREADVQVLIQLAEEAGAMIETAGAALGVYRAVTVLKGLAP